MNLFKTTSILIHVYNSKIHETNHKIIPSTNIANNDSSELDQMRRKVLEKRKKQPQHVLLTHKLTCLLSKLHCFISPRRRVDHHALCRTPSSFLWHRTWWPPPTMVRDPTPKNGCCWISWLKNQNWLLPDKKIKILN